MAIKYRSSRNSLRYKQYGMLGALVVIIGVSVYFANTLLQRAQDLSAGAAAGHATVFFQPQSGIVPPETSVDVWVSADKKLAFSHVEITFDKTRLKLAKEVDLTGVALNKPVVVTTMNEANNAGKITIATAVEKASIGNAPMGDFKLATLRFDKNTITSNQSVPLNFTTANLQLVDNTTVPFVTTAVSGSFTVNPSIAPVASPVPSPIVVIASPTPRPPSPNPSPIQTPTSLTPTPSPVVINQVTVVDITKPTLSLATGKFFGYTWVNSKASDASDIKSIAVSVNGSLKKTCNDNNCLYFWKPSSGTTYNVSVKATDKSATQNATTKTLVIQ